MLNTTLCYIEKDGRYLMLNRNKKKNDLNEGKWIGIGGKFEPGERPEECLLREVHEETGLVLETYRFHGIIHFRSDVEDEEMYLYTASASAEPNMDSCTEGTLAWIRKGEVLRLPVWEGDRLFLEKLIAGTDAIEMTLIYQDGKLVQSVDNLLEKTLKIPTVPA